MKHSDIFITDEDLINPPSPEEVKALIADSSQAETNAEAKKRYTAYMLHSHGTEKTLGKKWSEACKTDLAYIGSPKHIMRLVRAADTEYRLGVPTGTLIEYHTRSLYKLKDSELQKVWKQAIKLAGTDIPDAASIKHAISSHSFLNEVMHFLSEDASQAELKKVARKSLKGLKKNRRKALLEEFI